MRIGFQVVLFLLILNLMSALVYTLQIPGTNYTNILNTGSEASPEDFEQKFNSTTMLNQWDPTPGVSLLVVDDFAQGLYLFYQGVRAVLMGFPDMIDSFAYAIPDVTAQSAILNLMLLVRAISAFIIFAWIFQVISGRRVSE